MEEQKQTEEEQAYSDGGTADAKQVVERGTESEWLISETVDQFVPPVVALTSTFLAWATVNIPFLEMYRSMSGINTDTGQVILVVGMVVLGITVWAERFAGTVRYAGGFIIAALSLIQFWWNGQVLNRVLGSYSFDSDMAEMTASSVGVDAGIGLWLALLAGIAMVFVEYNHRRSS